VFGLGIQEAIEAPRINSLHPYSSFDSHDSEPGARRVAKRLTREMREGRRSTARQAGVLRPRGTRRNGE